MKKTFLNTLMAMFVLSFVIAMTSCNKDAGTNATTNPIEPQTANVIDQQVLPNGLLTYFDAHLVTVSGSLESPMQNSSPDFCGPDSGRVGPPPDSGKGGPPPPPGGDKGGMKPGNPMDNGGGFQFRDVLYRLKLTKAQVPATQKVIWAYQQCVQEVLVKSFAARKEIMYSAEQHRRAIMEAFKTALQAAGKDTALIHAARKKANEAMATLNKDTQAKLAALIDNTALCACWTKMVTDIEATLTADQLVIFQTWLAKQKTPCDAAATTGK
jgi:hypothetical protein